MIRALTLVLAHDLEPVSLVLEVSVLASGRVELAKRVRRLEVSRERAADEASARVVLTEAVGASLRAWVEHLVVASPDAASDALAGAARPGLRASVALGDETTARSVPLRGAWLEAIALLVCVARWQAPLGDLGERALLAHLDAAVRAQDESERLPVTARAGPSAVCFRARSLGVEELVVTRDEVGAGARLGARATALSPRDADALLASVDALLRTRTARVGAGEHLFEIEREGARVEVRSGDGSVESIPRAARLPVALLMDLAHAIDDDEALFAWRGRVPLLVRPVRTRDLVLRFHVRDARHGLAGERWYRLETHGAIVRCDRAGSDDEGRPVAPHEVPEDRFEAILDAMDGCEALGVGRGEIGPDDPWPDDDRFLELVLQRPRGDVLETTSARWSYGPMAPRDRTPAAERALDAVYTLYERLMKERLAADVD